MSKFSGKCDLADHIFGCGGYFDKDGNSVKFGQKDVGCYYSDEWLDFLAFKKKTDGTLYQHKNVKVNSYNKDDIKKYCKAFDYKEVRTKIEDKRNKDGFREEISYIYTYYGKEYTEKELNKKGGVYITVEIKFDTLLDLIQYYPYLVSVSYCSEDKQIVYISDRSYVDEEFDELVKTGYVSTMRDYYKKELTEHCREVSLKYYNPEGHIIEEEISFDKEGIGYTSKKVDDRFKVEWVENIIHFSSPKLIEGNKIKIDKNDLNKKSLIRYVEKFYIK